MSAFVVGSETMDRCVRAICAKDQYGQVVPQFAGLYTSEAKNRTEIGRRLFTLNVEAVMQRYPGCKDKPADMPGPTAPIPAAKLPARYTYEGSAIPASTRELPALVKALQCLRYQCNEGDVDKSPLYAELAAAIAALCEHIVEALPAYEGAPWG